MDATAQVKNNHSGRIFVWDRLTGKHRTVLELTKDQIVDLTWHPLQNIVVTVSGTTGQVRSYPRYLRHCGDSVDALGFTQAGTPRSASLSAWFGGRSSSHRHAAAGLQATLSPQLSQIVEHDRLCYPVHRRRY